MSNVLIGREREAEIYVLSARVTVSPEMRALSNEWLNVFSDYSL